MQTSILKQTAMLGIATLLVRLIGFLYRLPLTDMLGDRGNGLYAVGFHIYTFLLVVSTAGIPRAVAKMVSERLARGQYTAAHAVFRTALTAALGIGLVASLLLWLFSGQFAAWAGYPESVYAIRTLAPAIVLVAIMGVFFGYFQGMEKQGPVAFSQVIDQIFNAGFSVLLAFLFLDTLEHAAAGGTAGTTIGVMAGLLCVVGLYSVCVPRIRRRIRREANRTPVPRVPILKELLYTAFPIILGTAIFSLSNFIDMAMVSHRMGASGAFAQDEIEVLFGQLTGKYVLLVTLPVAISTVLASVLVPNMAASRTLQQHDEIVQKINMGLRLSMFVALPAAVGLFVLAGPILHLLFPNHPEGALLLQVGALSVIFLSLTQVTTGMLQGLGQVRVPVIGALVGAAAKIPLNYFLIAIPEVHVKGAIISTTVCYGIAAAVNLFCLKRTTHVHYDVVGILLKPVLAAGIMGLGTYVVYHLLYDASNNAVATLVAMVVGGGLYFWSMLVFGGMDDTGILPFIKKMAKRG